MKQRFTLTPLSFAIALALSTNIAHAEEMGTLVVEGDTEQSSTSNNFTMSVRLPKQRQKQTNKSLRFLAPFLWLLENKWMIERQSASLTRYNIRQASKPTFMVKTTNKIGL